MEFEVMTCDLNPQNKSHKLLHFAARQFYQQILTVHI
jgi:hypothetical protein